MTAALASAALGESKNHESSERDGDLTRPNLPHGLSCHRAWCGLLPLCECEQALNQILVLITEESACATRGNRRMKMQLVANDRLNSQQSLTLLFSTCQSGQEISCRRRWRAPAGPIPPRVVVFGQR